MSIHSKHDDYQNFLKNEINTLSFLSGNSSLYNLDSNIATQANDYSKRYISYIKNRRPFEFVFSCEFTLFVEKKERKIFLESQIKPDFEIATYCLSICENNEAPFNLIRKFHFDYAPQIDNKNYKPIYHIQYGGAPTPKIDEMELENINLCHWLSSPRINSIPINLALLIDLILCEFTSDKTKKITEMSEWRDLIKSNENVLLKGYFESVNSFFNRDHKSNSLFRDFYYGQTN